MLKAVVGHSNDPNTQSAIAEVLTRCKTALAGLSPQAGMLFAAMDFEHSEILAAIHQTFPNLQLIGGTSCGELSSVLGFQQDSLVLILFCSDEIEFQAAIGRNVSSDPVGIARQTVQSATASAQHPPVLCLTTPESLTVSGVSIVKGLQEALGKEVPIVGGSTSDQWDFKQTYQFFGTEVLSDALPILILSGPVLVGHGVATGWEPIGRTGVATKIENNVLYEIDGRPAVEFYQDCVGEVRLAPPYRLAVFESNRESWYMRTSNADNDSIGGTITFFADIPSQARVRAARGDRDEILNSVRASLQQALEHYPGTQPAIALLFSCSGRFQILGTRTQEEYQLLQPELPAGMVCAGFYTYGEIAPLRLEGETQLHHETFVTLLLGVE
ncbi:FIST N-terminal domain-containing protein [Oscillatoria sp. FACHB-1406]|uniref:FIST signal transduction protein n=1 Tax=Oscillatoria sp. FACHB-1406 TaxID=2692846 RepID=UPI001683516D|nr:FIST N-terminal domain-containing protein [Oscillatoria sp. FACHB-1406]MBD2579363.1 FIST C-terminal domain-containing protein [Oscillatoria sp. FACHB-1406]